jgi:F-type H+-transporting ATPase subunit a
VLKKGCLGCSFPLLIGILIIVLALVIIGFLAGPIGKSLFKVNLPACVEVASSHVELPAETVFHIGGFPITNSIIAAWVTIVVLVLLAWAATRKMKLAPKGLQNLFEFVVEALFNFCKSVAGEKNGRRFLPVVATIFLFVIFNAWLSLIPGFGTITIAEEGKAIGILRGANTDINMPLALALASFVAVTYFGIRATKIHFFAQFFNFGQMGRGLKQIFTGKLKSGLGSLFFGFIDVFVGLLELLSYFIRIVSFTFRLFGNMTAGEILLLIAAFLLPYVFSVIFYGLELFVGFVQALVFAGLTLVFLSMAVAGHGEESEHSK